MMDLLSEKSAVFQGLALVLRVKVQQHGSKFNQCLIVENVSSLRNRIENVLHNTARKSSRFFPLSMPNWRNFHFLFFKIIILCAI